MILGVDVGTFATKTNSGLIFRSGVSENNVVLNKSNTYLTTICNDSRTYTVGTPNNISNISIEMNKSISPYAKINFLTACALSVTKTHDYLFCVTGLPINQFSKNKEKYSKMLSCDMQRIIINGEEKNFSVNCKVFPEGASSIYSYGIDSLQKQRVLIIDIGGLTINVVEFFVNNGIELLTYKTFKKGTFVFYSQLAEKINAEYGINKTINDIPDLFENGLYIDGVVIDDYIKNKELDEFCFGLYNDLNLVWSTKDLKNIILTGGGSIILQNNIQKYIPQATIMPNAQFSNAIGYKIIASEIFNKTE